mgnify:CR=1 FL=1
MQNTNFKDGLVFLDKVVSKLNELKSIKKIEDVSFVYFNCTEEAHMKKYEKMKKKKKKIRRKFPGHGNISAIFPPPEPNNEERFEILKRWSINDNYNICMLTDYLTKNHDIRPCRDYEPDNLKYTYSLYSEMSENRTIVRSNTYHNCPSAPPVTNSRPPTPGIHSTPPKYDDLIL